MQTLLTEVIIELIKVAGSVWLAVLIGQKVNSKGARKMRRARLLTELRAKVVDASEAANDHWMTGEPKRLEPQIHRIETTWAEFIGCNDTEPTQVQKIDTGLDFLFELTTGGSYSAAFKEPNPEQCEKIHQRSQKLLQDIGLLHDTFV
jgi:hypothetical protein